MGLFSFYTHVEGRRYSGLAVDLRGLLIWTLGTALFGYLGAVTVLFSVWSRNKNLDLGYGEMLLLPRNWDSIQARRAQVSVNAGLLAMDLGRWADADMLIRSGLQRDPGLLVGRCQLASLCLATGRWAQGASFLEGGFAHRYPGLPYIQDAFAVAQRADDLARSTGWCRQLINRFGVSMPAGDRSWLLVREAQLFLAQGQYRELIALSSAGPNRTNPGLRELRTLALLKLGDWSQALDELNRWSLGHPKYDLLVTCLRAQAFRRGGKLDAMDAQLDLACSMAPKEPAVLLFSSTERFQAGQFESANLALESFLGRFGSNQALVESAMDRLFELKDGRGMDRLLQFAREMGGPLKQLLISKAVFDLNETNIRQSRTLFAELGAHWNLQSGRERFLRDYFQLLDSAATDVGDGPRLRFEYFCRDHSLEWADFSCAVRVLASFHREKAAMRILDVALERYPCSYHLAALKMEIQAAPTASVAPTLSDAKRRE